ncbi:MAG: FecR domain-containing protein [Candidatus Wallbacteria bacterium]|nr:FecR domain-containing protein [Candidatus Wallbacteria bacterium]
MRLSAIALTGLLLLSGACRAQEATIKSISGEAEVKAAPATDFVAAAVGAKLKGGDYIMTGFESTVVLAFEDNSEVTVYQLTQLRVDEFLMKENRAKTQLFLRVGTVQAKVKHTASVRSDFSVVTPTCTASVRGSEERVTYLPGFGTTVEYLEGLGLAQDARGRAVLLRANDTAKVSQSGSLATPGDVAQATAITDLTPQGAESRERHGSLGFNRLSIRPETDPNNPFSIVQQIESQRSTSSLIFRYDLLTDANHTQTNATRGQ